MLAVKYHEKAYVALEEDKENEFQGNKKVMGLLKFDNSIETAKIVTYYLETVIFT